MKKGIVFLLHMFAIPFAISIPLGSCSKNAKDEIVMPIVQNDVEIEINLNKIDLVSSYSAGVTHTQTSLNSWGNSGATNTAKVLLENSTYYQNQHIMGWGALNPWPDSTVTNSANWDWKSLDDRIKIIRDTKGKAVITLCGCPTWMHTPSSNGKTEWGDALEKAPTRAHFDDFAHLSAEVARRYPDVLYFQVWNELKGFWNMSLNRWRYEDYTTMYNMIYDSLKAINPAVKIGGPYPVMGTYSVRKSFTSDYGGAYGFFDKRPLDAIVYWLANKKGADFLCIDGGTHNKDEIWNVDAFKAGDKFTDAMAWIKQQLNQNTPLEIWWSEWYVHPRDTDPQNNRALNNAIMASGLIKTIKAGAGNVLIWQPEGDKDGFSFPLGIWTSTSTSDGGMPTPFYFTLKIFKDYFSKGVAVINTKSSSEDVSVIASDKKILLVNQKNTTVTVLINHVTTVSMTPYEVKLLDALQE